ncbi:MAG: AMP-binding protein [Pseudomonadota bacterium]|nr:AMP-binding protein [Pseudomonadota bacterium]
MMISHERCIATLQHLIAATLAADRGGSANAVVKDLQASDHLREGPAALDSLDQLAVARRVTEFFELEQTGAEEWLLRRHQLSEWSEFICDHLDDGTLTQIWFRSGGTTGEPKVVAQALTHLLSEVREIRNLVADTRRIIALVPLHHIYGFIWGPLLSQALNVPLIHGEASVDAAHHDLQPGDLLLGVPEWWQYLGQRRLAMPAGVTGVTSTAPCPPDVVREALSKGLEQMIEVYGSSDTGGIAWRRRLEDGFQLFQHWCKQGADHLLSEAGDVHALPDHVEWQSDRTLVPMRRRDEAIQIGGVNVWPEKVRAFIESHPGVQRCAVRPMTTEHGTRLKAFIVPAQPGSEGLEAELRRWLKANLSAAERPIRLTLGDELPRDAMGKLCDWS